MGQTVYITVVALILVLAGVVVRSIEQTSRIDAETVRTESASAIARAYAMNIMSAGARFQVRVADWTTDGYIRSTVGSINDKHSKEKIQELGEYIAKNKMSLDTKVSITDVLAPGGLVLVSSRPERVGIIDPSLASSTLSAMSNEYGKAITGATHHDLNATNEGDEFHFLAPIYRIGATGTPEAALAIHVPENAVTEYLQKDNLETGERLFLLDRTGRVIWSSIGGSEGKVDQDASPAFVSCRANKPYRGSYLKPDGRTVHAASECMDSLGLILVVEVIGRAPKQ